MIKLLGIFAIIYFHFSIDINAQTNNCDFKCTQWKIKRVAIKGLRNYTIKDSLYFESWYKKYDSLSLYFTNRANLNIIWRNYKAVGKYSQIISSNNTYLKILLKNLNRYDYGKSEKLEFGNFLHQLNYDLNYILNNCSFVVTSVESGLEIKILFERVN